MRIRLVAGLLLAAGSAAAAEDEVDCNNAMAQQDMNHCAYLDYEAADAELNAAWKDARKTAKDLDAELSDDLKGADKALLAAQRAWITYRDSARGMRLDIAAGTAVRFEPGQERDVTLVPFGGKREVYGFQQKVMGKL